MVVWWGVALGSFSSFFLASMLFTCFFSYTLRTFITGGQKALSEALGNMAGVHW